MTRNIIFGNNELLFHLTPEVAALVHYFSPKTGNFVFFARWFCENFGKVLESLKISQKKYKKKRTNFEISQVSKILLKIAKNYKNFVELFLKIISYTWAHHFAMPLFDCNVHFFKKQLHNIRLSGKFVQLVSKRISETVGFCHSIEGEFLLRYTNFDPIASFLSYEKKKNVLRTMCLHFLNMLNIEHRTVTKFFIREGLNAIEISKELESVYKNSAPSYRTIANWVAEFKDPERAFEDVARMGRRPSTITADKDIEAVERIVMHDRQISIRRLAEELTIIHEIMNNHMGMKKVCTRWMLELLTPIQRANRVDCCQELLQQREVNPDNFFHSIVTGDESWIRHYDPLSQLEAKV